MPGNCLFSVTTCHFHVTNNSMLMRHKPLVTATRKHLCSKKGGHWSKLKPTTAYHSGRCSVSISIHVPKIAELVHYFCSRSIINIHTKNLFHCQLGINTHCIQLTCWPICETPVSNSVALFWWWIYITNYMVSLLIGDYYSIWNELWLSTWSVYLQEALDLQDYIITRLQLQPPSSASDTDVGRICLCCLKIKVLKYHSWMAPWKNRTPRYFFRPSLNHVLFPMFCLLVEGECQILVF